MPCRAVLVLGQHGGKEAGAEALTGNVRWWLHGHRDKALWNGDGHPGGRDVSQKLHGTAWLQTAPSSSSVS